MTRPVCCRYDGRGALSDLRPHEPPPGGHDRWHGLTDRERKLEEVVDQERYMALYKDEDEERMLEGQLPTVRHPILTAHCPLPDTHRPPPLPTALGCGPAYDHPAVCLYIRTTSVASMSLLCYRESSM